MTEDDLLVVNDELIHDYRAYKQASSDVYALQQLALRPYFAFQVICDRDRNASLEIHYTKIHKFDYAISSFSILFKLIEKIKYELL